MAPKLFFINFNNFLPTPLLDDQPMAEMAQNLGIKKRVFTRQVNLLFITQNCKN
jgi:hypothetical protein